MNSSDSFSNVEKFLIIEFVLLQIRNLITFSKAQTEKNSWTKLVKTSDEFINCRSHTIKNETVVRILFQLF